MGYAVRQGGGSNGIVLDCEEDVVVNDYVYLSATTEKAGKAKADSRNTMPAIGKVVRRLSNNRCLVVQFHLETNLTGLVPKQRFFISPLVAGKLTTEPPTSTNHVLQCVAEAKSSSEMLVSVDPTSYMIRQ